MLEEKIESKENTEMRKALEKLEAYLKQGYLLHGGKSRLELVEPRQAHDDDGTRFTGNVYGVYAEDQDVRIPVVMALFDKKDKSKDFRSFYKGSGARSDFTVGGENLAFTPGFVHVLPAGSFKKVMDEKGNYEFVSTVPSHSVEVIPVEPSILKLLDKLTIET